MLVLLTDTIYTIYYTILFYVYNPKEVVNEALKMIGSIVSIMLIPMTSDRKTHLAPPPPLKELHLYKSGLLQTENRSICRMVK